MEQTEKAVPFWLVWNPGGNAPRFQHPSLESAENEAKRLARHAPGQEFFVLRPVSATLKSDIVTRRFAPTDNDIPF